MTTVVATAATVADSVARTVSSITALELHRTLHALGETDLADSDAVAWFVASQRAVLHARITLLTVRDLDSVPPAVAGRVLPRLLEIADAAVAGIPAAVLAADDGDAARTHIAETETVYAAVQGSATEALAEAGLP